MTKALSPHTIAAQAGHYLDSQTGAVVPPWQPSTTFARDEAYGLKNDVSYVRMGSDTAVMAADLIARLENAQASLMFPSGMAAIQALIRALPAGATVVMQSQIYWGTTAWMRDNAARLQITLIEGELSEPATLEALCAEHKPALVFVETPSNPWLRVTDIAHAAKVAHGIGALLVVDGTAATPVLTRALDHGADIAMHSATKGINGHSDVLAGVLSTNAPDAQIWQTIALEQGQGGAVLGPFEAWLLIRGIRTLPLRVERMTSNAQILADRLADHPGVEAVLYPGLSSHQGHATAAKQMSAFGSLLSFIVPGGATAALGVAGRLNLFHRATSLGGVESLVEHRHSIEPHTGIPEGLLRVSVGIEDADDLWMDLVQALEA